MITILPALPPGTGAVSDPTFDNPIVIVDPGKMLPGTGFPDQVPDPTFDNPPVVLGGPKSRAPLSNVIAEHLDALFAIPGVAGIGEGETDAGKACIVVMTNLPVSEVHVPNRLGGYPVKKEYSGEIGSQ